MRARGRSERKSVQEIRRHVLFLKAIRQLLKILLSEDRREDLLVCERFGTLQQARLLLLERGSNCHRRLRARRAQFSFTNRTLFGQQGPDTDRQRHRGARRVLEGIEAAALVQELRPLIARGNSRSVILAARNTPCRRGRRRIDFRSDRRAHNGWPPRTRRSLLALRRRMERPNNRHWTRSDWRRPNQQPHSASDC